MTTVRSAVVALLIAASGCGDRSVSSPPPGQVVARVGDQSITVDQVADEARRTGQTPAAALEELIRLELVVGAAGRGTSPEQQKSLEELRKSMMVQRYIEREVEPELAQDRIPDAVTRPFYDRALHNFVHGRLVEVGALVLFTGANMKPEPRAARETAGRELQALVKARGLKTEAQFRTLADDPVWQQRGVRFMRFFQDLEVPYCRELGEAAQSLKKPGDATGLVVCSDGAFVATYLGERPAENNSYESVRPKLREGLWQRWRGQRFEEISLTLARSHQAYEERERIVAAPPRSDQE